MAAPTSFRTHTVTVLSGGRPSICTRLIYLLLYCRPRIPPRRFPPLCWHGQHAKEVPPLSPGYRRFQRLCSPLSLSLFFSPSFSFPLAPFSDPPFISRIWYPLTYPFHSVPLGRWSDVSFVFGTTGPICHWDAPDLPRRTQLWFQLLTGI